MARTKKVVLKNKTINVTKMKKVKDEKTGKKVLTPVSVPAEVTLEQLGDNYRVVCEKEVQYESPNRMFAETEFSRM